MSLIDIDLRDDVGVTLDAQVDEECWLFPRDERRWKAELATMVGQDVRVTITRWKKRSPEQNRLLWGVYREIMSKLRDKYAAIHQACPLVDEDELHEVMKARYLPGERVEVLGHMEHKTGSSTKLSTTEFSRYVERVVAHAAEWGVYVSLPGDLIESWNQ